MDELDRQIRKQVLTALKIFDRRELFGSIKMYYSFELARQVETYVISYINKNKHNYNWSIKTNAISGEVMMSYITKKHLPAGSINPDLDILETMHIAIR